MFVKLKNIITKISVFYLITWIILLYSWYYYFFQKNNSSSTKSNTQASFEVVWTWSLKESIDVVWTSQLVDEQTLSFNQAWTITKVNFKAWDNVKKWDIIAELDNTDWENALKQAELSLEDAKISLQELYKDPDESQILQSKNTITNTQNSILIAKEELQTLITSQNNSIESFKKDIENAKKSLEISKKELETSKTSLELSKKDLELAQKNYDLTLKQQTNSLSNTSSNKDTTIKQTENSFTSDLTSISKIIEQLDYILWVTDANKNKNDAYEMFLSAKNSSYKTSAENSLNDSISAFDKLKKVVDSYDYSSDTNKIKNILWEFKIVYSSLENSTDLTYKVLEWTIWSTYFSETEIDSKKSTVYSYLTTVQSKLNSITSSINSLNTLTDTELVSISNDNNLLSLQNSIAQKESSIKSQEISIQSKEVDIESKEKSIQKQQNDLETTKKTYETNLKTKQNNISQLENTLKVNQESYNELVEWPTDENVRKAKNNITQSQLKVESAKKALDDYKLEAPFDWVVRKIDYMVWDNLNNDTDKSVYIENPNLLEITVMLDQVDIAKVEVWTKAVVTFDAFSTTPADAVITQIDTTPVQSSWVTSYEVTLILDDDDFDKNVLSWMTWDVEIITESKENVLIISSTAISTKDWKNYVTINDKWQTKSVEVVTWMVSFWKTEIVSWLSLWDRVVTTSYSLSSTWEQTTKSNSLFPTSSWNRSSWTRSSWFWWPPGWF